MLRSFRLGNHRSFGDEQELLLMPSLPANNRVVLPVTAIYGANASGKSNLLDGLRFMRQAVLGSFGRWEAEGGVPRRPFRLAPGSSSRPSTFVTELLIEGVPFTFGFTADDERVCEEWLYSYPEKRKRVLFERDGEQISFGSTVPDMKAKLGVLQELTRPNALFLSLAAQSRLDTLRPVHRWFQKEMVFRSRGGVLREPTEAIKNIIEKNALSYSRFLGLLTAADVDITDVRMEEIEEPRMKRHTDFLERKTQDLAAKVDGAVNLDEKIRLEDEQEHLRLNSPMSDLVRCGRC